MIVRHSWSEVDPKKWQPMFDTLTSGIFPNYQRLLMTQIKRTDITCSLDSWDMVKYGTK